MKIMEGRNLASHPTQNKLRDALHVSIKLITQKIHLTTKKYCRSEKRKF